MKKVLIISFSDLANDPRVNRQIRLLAGHYDVTAAGYANPEVENVNYISVEIPKDGIIRKLVNASLLLLKLYSRYYWSTSYVKSAYKKLNNIDFDLIMANDLNSLPLAFKLSKYSNAKLVFDAHEYSPRQFEDQFQWRVLFLPFVIWQCKKYLPQVDAMMTVCQGLADEYERNFYVKSLVIPNSTKYYELSPSEIDDRKVRMVYHGGANVSRKLELMIDLVNELDDRYTLDLLLVGDKKYIKFLKQRARGNDRIKFIPPVPMEQLPVFTNKYDIGIFLLPPTNYNYEMALPNKLFEYIQARLVVAIGPSPEMEKVVKQYDCGVVASEFTSRSLAARLEDMDKQRLSYYKAQSDKAAKQVSFEVISKKLLDMLSHTLGR